LIGLNPAATHFFQGDFSMEPLQFSFTLPIPALRTDIDFIPFEENGEEYIALRDPQGYSKETLVLKTEAGALLALFDGTRSILSIEEEVFKETHVRIDPKVIADFVAVLDEHLFLESERLQDTKKQEDAAFLRSPVRPAAFAGLSYPEEGAELTAFFDSLFQADETPIHSEGLIGILAPHIDLHIGPEVYVPGFRSLLETDFDVAIILGTSHNSAEDMFMMTEKHFETPLGTLRTDVDLVRLIHERTNQLFTKNDLAHKMEHSIEFPVLFLQHLFGNEKKTIVPVLCSSFEEFIHEGILPSAHHRYWMFVSAVRRVLEEAGKKAVFILSVDWSHVGRKFGDDFAAGDTLTVLEQSDRRQLEALERADYAQFFSLLHNSKNASHIDGFTCISTFFDIVQPARGKLLMYKQWHEIERESAVTFAGMTFHK
jgi:MEMO1 family protein